jgi:hypothetical protein
VEALVLLVLAAAAGVALLVALVVAVKGDTRAGQIGLRSAREIVDQRDALEAEDLAQMLAVLNERRRARGEPDLSAIDIELRLMQDELEQRRG